jgi:luciferase family oxidoreductase group 1
MTGPLRLGVLDQSPIPDGLTATDALRNSIDLARHAERLGYHRYWVAEHHNSDALAGSSPEILIGQIAAATVRMRIGSGGVMLSHYSALKVVENFRMLHALFPGRIDLGVGRAPGSDGITAVALQRTHRLPGDDEFPIQLAELMGFLGNRFEPQHPFSKIDPSPRAPGGPELWLLGSSGYSAAYAAHLGLPFCHAHFINPVDSEAATAQYRRDFQVHDDAPAPRVAVACSVICAEDDDEATRLASSLRLWRARRAERGEPGPIPSVEEALASPLLDGPAEPGYRQPRRLITGGPKEVRTQIEELADAHGADEVVLVTIVHDHAARVRSYELIADAFGLAG